MGACSGKNDKANKAPVYIANVDPPKQSPKQAHVTGATPSMASTAVPLYIDNSSSTTTGITNADLGTPASVASTQSSAAALGTQTNASSFPPATSPMSQIVPPSSAPNLLTRQHSGGSSSSKTKQRAAEGGSGNGTRTSGSGNASAASRGTQPSQTKNNNHHHHKNNQHHNHHHSRHSAASQDKEREKRSAKTKNATYPSISPPERPVFPADKGACPAPNLPGHIPVVDSMGRPLESGPSTTGTTSNGGEKGASASMVEPVIRNLTPREIERGDGMLTDHTPSLRDDDGDLADEFIICDSTI